MAGLADLMKNTSSIPKEKKVNKYLENKDDGLNLLASLISAKSSNNNVENHLRELEIMIENEFLTLAEKDKCPGSAEAFSNLQKAFDDLVDIVNFPELENKFTVAVGGQFSAGKSKFLNTLLGSRRLLPTDTSATTSIPTYILNGDKDSVYALNNFQHKAEIDGEALHAISHAFKSSYGISFSHILKLITVERESFKWDKLTFLDTPGYSKADSVKNRHDNTDENIAREHLRTADYLIWLIDIQSGTIPEDDINFIRSLDYDEPILFVFNKADKKTDNQIQKVISTTKENLDRNEIKYFEVIGFSSMKKVEYSDKGDVLDCFLKGIEAETPGTEIHKRFERILEDYLNFHKSEIEFLRISRGTVNEATVDAHVEDKYGEKLKITTKKQQKQIAALIGSEKAFDKLREKINTKVKEIFKELEIEIKEGHVVERKKRSTSASETFRFDAMIQFKDKSNLEKLTDLKNITGEVKKVSAIGVSIDIEHGGNVLITSAEIKKKTNVDHKEIFYESNEVKVDYLGNNKAVVEIEKRI